MTDHLFETVARHFLFRTWRATNWTSIGLNFYEAPGYHPRLRIVEASYSGNDRNVFVVKILGEGRDAYDKTVQAILQEMRTQCFLNQLHLRNREYLFLDSEGENPTHMPFVVASYIPGESAEEVGDRNKRLVILREVTDQLFSLHSRTITRSFGYEFDETCRRRSSYRQFASRYLFADIQEEGLGFSAADVDLLEQTVERLEEANLFCFCHGDITEGNIIIDGDSVHLIDWSYSHFGEPSLDIANIVFYFIEWGFFDEALQLLAVAEERYRKLGFQILERFYYYLAQRYIEVGRVRGSLYVEKGKALLKVGRAHAPSSRVIEILRSRCSSTENRREYK